MITVLGIMQPASLCNVKVAGNTLCEYTLVGKYGSSRNGTAMYECCPHSATTLQKMKKKKKNR